MNDTIGQDNNLPPHLLASTRQFYISRVKLGSIPIELGNGTYYHSYNKDDFDVYLSRFSKQDRKHITEGVKLSQQTQEKTNKLLAQLLTELQTDEVEQLVRKLSS